MNRTQAPTAADVARTHKTTYDRCVWRLRHQDAELNDRGKAHIARCGFAAWRDSLDMRIYRWRFDEGVLTLREVDARA